MSHGSGGGVVSRGPGVWWFPTVGSFRRKGASLRGYVLVMPETLPRSGVFRRVLIYLGVVGPLPGDEVSERDELEGELRTIREVLHWVVVGAAVVVSGTVGDSWLERVIVLVVVVLVLGLLLRAFNAWALRRQRARRASM